MARGVDVVTPQGRDVAGMSAGANTAATATDDYAFGSRRVAWYAASVFCALQLSSNMDRQVISLVVEPLRRDFALDDIQIGLLQGLAFALFYALAAIPIGWMADRWRRDRIIFWGATIWTLATVACMLAPDYPALFVARMLVGLGEAALVPAAFSLLGDYFPRARVAGAVSVVTGASFLNSLNSLLTAGRDIKNPRVPALSVNNITALRKAVDAGVGIAVLPEYLLNPESGLVQLLPSADMPELECYLVYPEEMKNVARVQVFRDFLVSNASRWKY